MISADVARLIRERAAGFCEYCRCHDADSTLPFHIEHVRARVHGGSDDTSNLALACAECNWHKGPNLTGIDPDSDRITSLFNPRTQRWEDHFTIENGRVIPLSAEGRTTVWLFQMNAPERIRNRQRAARRKP